VLRPSPALLLLLLAACPGAEPPPADDDDAPACEAIVPAIEASTLSGTLPLTVHFDASSSCAPAGIAVLRWDFGTQEATGPTASHTWLGSGTFPVTLTVVDSAGASAEAEVEVTVEPAPCPEARHPVAWGPLQSDQLSRPSGLAASRVHDGLLWSHNDAGEGSTLFALDRDGAEVAVFPLDAVHSDWEDVAVGLDPTTGVSTVYIGDLGDDDGDRNSVRLVMVPEPGETLLAEPKELETSMLELTYPDEQRLDADALMFDPQTGDLYIVVRSADGDTSELYRKAAPHLPGSTRELQLVREVDLGGSRATSASISPLGDRILVRTRSTAWLWLRDGSQPLEAAFDAEVCPAPVPDESGHEAVAFDAAGGGFWTLAEHGGSPLWLVEFEPPPCETLEARIDTTSDPPFHVPVELTFELDTDCVPAGIEQVEWSIDGQVYDEVSPTVLLQQSGRLDVSATLTDASGATATGSRAFQLAPAPCPVPQPPEAWGQVVNPEINETSGLALSTTNEGVLWLHNDSGDSARLFAIGTDGAWLGTWHLDVDARDWEDLAYGWDDELGGMALYVGDVGDNAEERESISVHVVPEPAVPGGGPVEVELDDDAFATMELTYPDGPHNCETLMWDPPTGDLYIVTKKSGHHSHVFRKPAPHVDGTSTELEPVISLRFGQAPLSGSSNTTGGDISAAGDRVMIRTYSRAWLWRREPGQTIEEALEGTPCDAEAPEEPQSEAICFTPDGGGYVTVSEGTDQPVWFTPLDP